MSALSRGSTTLRASFAWAFAGGGTACAGAYALMPEPTEYPALFAAAVTGVACGLICRRVIVPQACP